MTTWVFRGTLLPDGADGELAVGTGETEELPGRSSCAAPASADGVANM